MAKEDIPKLLAEAKAALDGEHSAFTESVREKLDSYRRKALSKV